MTTIGNDFEAAKAVADQLQGMEKERQQRILRWVAESLSLDLGTSAAAGRRAEDASAKLVSDGSVHQATDIKTFVDSKRPKSDVQFAAVVAYYYSFEAAPESRKESIDAQVLQDAARLAGRRRPPKPLMTLNNAKMLGYLDSPERGQFRVNSVGENLVAMTLPGSEAERTLKRVRSTKRKKPKVKKR